MAYVILKNSNTILSRSLNKHTWKYLDECQEAAIKECGPGDIVEICELTPKFVYKLELNTEEVPGHVCSGSNEPSLDGPSDDEPVSGSDEPSQEEGNDKEEEPAAPSDGDEDKTGEDEEKLGLPITDVSGEEGQE